MMDYQKAYTSLCEDVTFLIRGVSYPGERDLTIREQLDRALNRSTSAGVPHPTHHHNQGSST